jgi:glycosyltransferase involved in cell wall biosynthesis
VSVIIPVYNAERFLVRAVESALQFGYVKEVLLIEDGSTDNSLNVCRVIAMDFPDRVKVLQHANGMNKGAGETRNVGLLHAQCNYISFLDADDYYLENRFINDMMVFDKHPDADGAYNALGSIYDNETLKEKFLLKGLQEITTVSHEVHPEELKDVWLGLHDYKLGYFHLDTLTLKRESLKKVPLFNPKLRLHQDTEWLIKLSFLIKLYSSEIVKPVAIRTVHQENRVTRFTTNKSRALMYKALLDWAKRQGVSREYKRIIKYRYVNYLLSSGSSRLERFMHGLNAAFDKDVIFNMKFLKLYVRKIVIMEEKV